MNTDMDFSDAVYCAKEEGEKVKRRGWVNQWLRYDGVRKNLARRNPFVMHMHNGSWQAGYVPSWEDMDAEDWEIVE